MKIDDLHKVNKMSLLRYMTIPHEVLNNEHVYYDTPTPASFIDGKTECLDNFQNHAPLQLSKLENGIIKSVIPTVTDKCFVHPVEISYPISENSAAKTICDIESQIALHMCLTTCSSKNSLRVIDRDQASLNDITEAMGRIDERYLRSSSLWCTTNNRKTKHLQSDDYQIYSHPLIPEGVYICTTDTVYFAYTAIFKNPTVDHRVDGALVVEEAICTTMFMDSIEIVITRQALSKFTKINLTQGCFSQHFPILS